MATNANKDYEPAHVPYLAPVEPTVTPGSTHPGSQLPTIATLPPIASARPPLQNQLPTTNVGASNIPVVNGVRQTPATFASHVTQPHYPPTVVNLSALPSAAPPHALPEQLMPPFFEYMDKCRYVAGFMLCYYICTFFFLQPFFLGTLGIMTGFLGYFGARPPIYAGHVKWVRGFIWMNYSMVVMNVWYLAITVFFISSFKSLERDSSTAADGSGSKDSTVYYHTYNEEHLGLFIGVVVALNLMLHFRGIRAAKHFHAEMLRAGPLPGHRTVIVLGSQQPVQQV